MAQRQWAYVYFHDKLAGVLEENRTGGTDFAYDAEYLAEGGQAISYTLPVREEPYSTPKGLLPYFDNLVAEGWLGYAQARALGVHPDDRLALLISFGVDCIGAVSIRDPDPPPELAVDLNDPMNVAALSARASLSGVQPKLAAVKEGSSYRPAGANEISTYIAKMPSPHIPGLLEVELLTLEANRVLLKDDAVAEAELAMVHPKVPALVIKRFDRTDAGQKLHFEEFNQLLGKWSHDKYEGGYEEMARFIETEAQAGKVETDRLFRRILACILTGNTDAHFKNFGLFETGSGYSLVPAYDLVASAVYPEFQTMALSICGSKDHQISELKPKHIICMAEGFGLSHSALRLALEDLEKAVPAAKESVSAHPQGSQAAKDKIIKMMEKRWNGIFALIGQQLSKRPKGGARRKGLASGD